jgi:hypothetical protein
VVPVGESGGLECAGYGLALDPKRELIASGLADLGAGLLVAEARGRDTPLGVDVEHAPELGVPQYDFRLGWQEVNAGLSLDAGWRQQQKARAKHKHA